MTGTRKGALIEIAAQVIFGTWAMALTLLFLLAQAPHALSDAVVRNPRLVVLNEWRATLMPQLSATYKQ